MNLIHSLIIDVTECVLENPDVVVFGYIDPKTMHSVFTSWGPILAFFTVFGGMIVSCFLIFYHRWCALFKKYGWKLFAVFIIVTTLLAVIIAIFYKVFF